MSQRVAVAGMALGAVAVLAGTYVLRADPALTQALSAVGTVGAAIFTAVAAVAAMRAAQHSSATARNAREALARAVQPSLSVYVMFDQPYEHGDTVPAVGQVVSMRGDAREVEVEWHLADRKETGRTDVLMGRHEAMPLEQDLSFGVALGHLPTATWYDEVKLVRVTYWDDRRIAQWETTWRGHQSSSPATAPALIQLGSRLIG